MALSDDLKRMYLPTIGIECHVQLKTVSKLFSAVGNDAREAAPNTLVSPVDFGLPGSLPVLNERAVELAVRAGIALNGEIARWSKFDRKHYFYPDLPKGYQISQYDEPIVGTGYVEIEVEGETQRIGIHRAHLEEDAGKSTHPEGADYSLVDLNRAGTPLLEIVSNPDIHSAAAARVYAQELFYLMRFADISDADLYHGNMRFDVNVSVANKESGELGTRAEVKNLNSFRSVERAVEFEIERQIKLLERGEKVVQETRGWDESKQRTFSQRGKEEANDYRYFPDPDLPPIQLTEEFISKIEQAVPRLPADWRKVLKSVGADASQIETLIEAEAETGSVGYLELVSKGGSNQELTKFMINWIINIEIPARRSAEQTFALDPGKRIEVYQAVFTLVQANKISSSQAKVLHLQLLSIEAAPADVERFAKDHGLLQVSDEAELERAIDAVMTNHPQAVSDVASGELKAIGFLTGQVMKEMGGNANPQAVQEMLRKKLGQ